MPTETGSQRARQWLRRRHLAGVEPTPLLLARLDARRTGNRAELAVTALCVAGLVAWSATRGRNPTDVDNLVWLVTLNLALVAGMLAGFWRQRQVERPLLASRRTRSAHPSATSPVRVLGTGQLTMSASVYGGGLLLGTMVAVLAGRPAERAIAVAFILGVAAMAAAGALALAAVLRRPSLAEDPDSLLVDDLLRAEDGRRAVVPYPILVALIVGVDTAAGSWLMWPFLAYAAAGAVSWFLAERAVHCVPTAETVGRP